MVSQRCIAITIALTSSLLCSMPLEVLAAPDLLVTAKDTPKSQRSAYAQGKQAAQRDDGQGALEAWAAVLAATPESSKTRRFRMKLVIDTLHVALDAHARQPNPALLEQALDVYYTYFAAHEAQYGNHNIPGPVVDARFDLKAAIDAAEPSAPPPVPASETPAEPPPPPPPPSDGSPSISLSTSQRDSETKGDGAGLLIAGGVTMAVGAGLTSLIAVGAINGKQTREDLDDPSYSPEQRSRIDAEGKKANTMFIAGLVSAPLALVTGAVLVGIGAKRRVDTRRGYASVAPSVNPTFAGLQIHGRF
ncbi:MAG: hypothetical protein KUG77_06020 [Nannocystaceae bacterium]|nr:hypothetical protein [Nannocystaceae bacterium]